MSRYTVRFDSETAKKLEQNAVKKKIAIAHYIRNLVDIGLRVEEANSDKNKDSDADKMRKELQLKSYKASIETLLIIRRLVGYTNNTKDNSEDILKCVSEKAQAYIDGYLGDNV